MMTMPVPQGPAEAGRHDRLEATRWDAVLARARAADFVYGVRSTGVYCRPSCPSRRPRRDRTVFFDTTADARAAGFRACRRCHPDGGAAVDPWVDKIRRACVYLANVDGHPSLVTLARRVGGSPYHLQRNFKRIVGVTPREYAEACRLRSVKRRLRAGGDVTRAMVDAGYGSSGRFYERAAPKLGMTPSEYRRGADGVRVAYTIVDSPLGRLLVAATARGVCSIAMGASDRELIAALGVEYPRAVIECPTEVGRHDQSGERHDRSSGRRDRAELARWARAVVAHLAGREPRLDLPLDVRATAFQWQVWQALAAIPFGQTRTYGDIATAIGRPTASRAVARACATNPVALAIPCHRVVPAAGGEGGYRWGAARKRALLARERGGAG